MILAHIHNDLLVWLGQFKTAVLAQAATFGMVAADTTPITLCPNRRRDWFVQR